MVKARANKVWKGGTASRGGSVVTGWIFAFRFLAKIGEGWAQETTRAHGKMHIYCHYPSLRKGLDLEEKLLIGG